MAPYAEDTEGGGKLNETELIASLRFTENFNQWTLTRMEVSYDVEGERNRSRQ